MVTSSTRMRCSYTRSRRHRRQPRPERPLADAFAVRIGMMFGTATVREIPTRSHLDPSLVFAAASRSLMGDCSLTVAVPTRPAGLDARGAARAKREPHRRPPTRSSTALLCGSALPSSANSASISAPDRRCFSGTPTATGTIAATGLPRRTSRCARGDARPHPPGPKGGPLPPSVTPSAFDHHDRARR